MTHRATADASNPSLEVYLCVLVAGLALLLSGCAESRVMAQRPSPAQDNAVLQDYVGLSESQARDLAQGRDTPFRVVTRDGVSQRVTFDFVRGRINADVRDGVVVTYTVEGAKQRTQKVPPGVKTLN